MISGNYLVALEEVTQALEASGIEYHVGGSVASSAHGKPRSTVDVDLVAALSSSHVVPLVAALRDRFYIDEDAVREALSSRRSFNVIHLDTMLKVDIFVAGAGPYDAEELRRTQRVALTDEPDARLFPVKSPEDTVLRKLEWFRAGGEVSDRQWLDTLNVIKVQAASLDRAYLRRWAPELGVADLLEEVLRDADAAEGVGEP